MTFEINLSNDKTFFRDVLTALFNRIHERRSLGLSTEELEREAWETLKRFEATEVPMDSNPAWAMHTMRGGFYNAIDRLDEALHNDKAALRVAKDPLDLWISNYNVCGELRGLGRVAEASRHACELRNLDKGNPLSHLEVMFCLAKTGEESAANDLLGELVDMADFASAHDALANALRYETEAHQLDLPATTYLLSQLAA